METASNGEVKRMRKPTVPRVLTKEQREKRRQYMRLRYRLSKAGSIGTSTNIEAHCPSPSNHDSSNLIDETSEASRVDETVLCLDSSINSQHCLNRKRPRSSTALSPSLGRVQNEGNNDGD